MPYRNNTKVEGLAAHRKGKWSSRERILFLMGLQKFGRGRWKEIGTILKTRNAIQLKSHGQKLMKKLDGGDDIFAELEQIDSNVELVRDSDGEGEEEGPIGDNTDFVSKRIGTSAHEEEYVRSWGALSLSKKRKEDTIISGFISSSVTSINRKQKRTATKYKVARNNFELPRKLRVLPKRRAARRTQIDMYVDQDSDVDLKEELDEVVSNTSPTVSRESIPPIQDKLSHRRQNSAGSVLLQHPTSRRPRPRRNVSSQQALSHATRGIQVRELPPLSTPIRHHAPSPFRRIRLTNRFKRGASSVVVIPTPSKLIATNWTRVKEQKLVSPSVDMKAVMALMQLSQQPSTKPLSSKDLSFKESKSAFHAYRERYNKHNDDLSIVEDDGNVWLVPGSVAPSSDNTLPPPLDSEAPAKVTPTFEISL